MQDSSCSLQEQFPLLRCLARVPRGRVLHAWPLTVLPRVVCCCTAGGPGD